MAPPGVAAFHAPRNEPNAHCHGLPAGGVGSQNLAQILAALQRASARPAPPPSTPLSGGVPPLNAGDSASQGRAANDNPGIPTFSLAPGTSNVVSAMFQGAQAANPFTALGVPLSQFLDHVIMLALEK